MPYATVADVTAWNSLRTFSATSKPTATQVVDFLDEAAAVIDGILTAQGYSVPVATSASQARKLLEHYNSLGAWARVERSAEASPDRDRAEQLWADAQKMLRTGQVVLPDAAKNTDRAYPRGPADASAFFSRSMEL